MKMMVILQYKTAEHFKMYTNFYAKRELDEVAVPPAATEAKNFFGLKLLSRLHDVPNKREFQVFESDDVTQLMSIYDSHEMMGCEVTRFPVLDDAEWLQHAKKIVDQNPNLYGDTETEV